MAVVVNDSLDLAFSLQVSDGHTSERSVDLHSVNKSRLRDHLESGHFLENSIISGLVQDDHVDCLVLDLSLRPFLLLGVLCRSRGLSRREQHCQHIFQLSPFSPIDAHNSSFPRVGKYKRSVCCPVISYHLRGTHFGGILVGVDSKTQEARASQSARPSTKAPSRGHRSQNKAGDLSRPRKSLLFLT